MALAFVFGGGEAVNCRRVQGRGLAARGAATPGTPRATRGLRGRPEACGTRARGRRRRGQEARKAGTGAGPEGFGGNCAGYQEPQVVVQERGRSDTCG